MMKQEILSPAVVFFPLLNRASRALRPLAWEYMGAVRYYVFLRLT